MVWFLVWIESNTYFFNTKSESNRIEWVINGRGAIT